MKYKKYLMKSAVLTLAVFISAGAMAQSLMPPKITNPNPTIPDKIDKIGIGGDVVVTPPTGTEYYPEASHIKGDYQTCYFIEDKDNKGKGRCFLDAGGFATWEYGINPTDLNTCKELCETLNKWSHEACKKNIAAAVR